MKSILFIVPLPPPVHGSSIMAEAIRNSKTINNGINAHFINLSTSRRIDEIGKKPLLKLLRIFCVFLKVLWTLLTTKIDKCYIAMQCYGVGFLKDACIALLCKAFGKRLIIHHHTFGIANYKDKPIYRTLYRCIYNHAEVILLSDLMRSHFGNLLDNAKVIIVPNGIDSHCCSSFSFSNRDSEAPRLLFLSNLLPSKGIYDLLDACAILKAEGLRFECQFIGAESREISAATFAHEASKRGIADCATYLGKKFGNDKWQCFANADIFVHPSCDDCMPLVILEAMDFALPVVATNIGCIPDEVIDGDNGYLIEPNNAPALADALKRLITDKHLRHSMGKAGKSRFDKFFTSAAFENNICKVLSFKE